MNAKGDISLRLFSQSMEPNAVGYNDKFFDNLATGKIALIEYNYLVKYQKREYCKVKPRMGWHISPAHDFPKMLSFWVIEKA